MVAEPLRDLSASDSEGRKDHIPGRKLFRLATTFSPPDVRCQTSW